jgi:hypothetical protein
MGIHKTNYKTENGKTRKVKEAAKHADKNGAHNVSGANVNKDKPKQE